MGPHDDLVLLVLLLLAVFLPFACAVVLINVVYRLVTGRFFRWLGRPVWIALGIYLAPWIAFLYLAATSETAFLITH
jgi:hypothetical protein